VYINNALLDIFFILLENTISQNIQSKFTNEFRILLWNHIFGSMFKSSQ